MPYIEKGERRLALAPVTEMDAETPGDLNFQIACLVDDFLAEAGGVSYTNINTVIGVLECAKLEVYRRLAAGYEDAKNMENGEVFVRSLPN